MKRRKSHTVLPAGRRPRKTRKNLTLDSDALVLAESMRVADRRPSLVNELEFLVFEEAKRRGLPVKVNGNGKEVGK